MSDSLWPRRLQHTRLTCHSLSPRVCSNSCPSSRWCHPTISSSFTPISSWFNLSQHQSLFQWIGFLHQLAKVLELQLQHQSGLISFGIDWFELLAVQGTLKSLLQHHSSKASILWHSAFFMVQFSHLYMTTGKTVALTIWTFVGKVMSLVFNRLSRFVIAFLPRSNSLLISWLQPPFAVILKPKKIKSAMGSVFFPNYLPWNDGTRYHDLGFMNAEF